jgi:hypothetical protein
MTASFFIQILAFRPFITNSSKKKVIPKPLCSTEF